MQPDGSNSLGLYLEGTVGKNGDTRLGTDRGREWYAVQMDGEGKERRRGGEGRTKQQVSMVPDSTTPL